MIDHLLGRPSKKIKKVHVILVSVFWLVYLVRGPRHGPPGMARLSRALSERTSAWQVLVMTLTGLYVLKNFDKLANLQAPEPLENMYTRNFYRASWILTALDAGFWTAMPVQPKALRDVASIVFSMYYLVFADQADEKVRKVRATLTTEHLRVSWEKGSSPYLGLAHRLLLPRVAMRTPLRIARPPGSTYTDPVAAVLFFDGTRAELRQQTRLVLSLPGGGFVSMSPADHEDELVHWAKRGRLPVLALDYKKAPEHPYPYSLDECFEAYVEIMRTNGQCIGLGGTVPPQVCVVADSAGGNFAAGLVLRVLTHDQPVPVPAGLVLAYPALDLNFTSWMTDDQLRVIRQESRADLHGATLMRSKENTYADLSASTKGAAPRTHIGTELAMTSRVSYFSDKIITPEMLRAMVILYVGPDKKPDFMTDYLLSPANAPSELLAQFPRTFIICGEVDPLVDDTVIFAGRLRQAKAAAAARRRNLAMSRSDAADDPVEVVLLKGVSHGFMQMAAFLPEGAAAISRMRVWIERSFALAAPIHPPPLPVPLAAVAHRAARRREPRKKPPTGLRRAAVAVLAQVDLDWLLAPVREVAYDSDSDGFSMSSEDEAVDDLDPDDRPIEFSSPARSVSASVRSASEVRASPTRPEDRPSPLRLSSGSGTDQEDAVDVEGEALPEPRRRRRRQKSWDGKASVVAEGDLISRRRHTIVRSLGASEPRAAPAHPVPEGDA
ncbi:Alpha/Beta hydrolase protein [Dipodascopsis tothii]|uniref:Alpha/Beta hydrolase protein n=1 Tax=Dipodascopsis tothii TaxID=44089 RepID=UPI0034D016AF